MPLNVPEQRSRGFSRRNGQARDIGPYRVVRHRSNPCSSTEASTCACERQRGSKNMAVQDCFEISLDFNQ